MTSVFHRLFGGERAFRNLPELMVAVHEENDADIEKQGESLSDDERQKVCIKVADTIRQCGAKSSLETAALLFLFEASTQETHRGEFFKTMEHETGIGRTQLYRMVAVHRKFGRLLFAEPQAMGMFVCESLKLLSEASVSDAARLEAIERARAGNRINIAEAKAIRRRHQSMGKSDAAGSKSNPKTIEPQTNDLLGKGDRSSSRQWLWRFDLSTLSICIGRSKKGQAISADAIVKALESALKKARQELSSAQPSSSQNSVA